MHDDYELEERIDAEEDALRARVGETPFKEDIVHILALIHIIDGRRKDVKLGIHLMGELLSFVAAPQRRPMLAAHTPFRNALLVKINELRAYPGSVPLEGIMDTVENILVELAG